MMLFALDKIQLGFKAGDKLFFLFNLFLGFFDEISGRTFDVVRVAHAQIKGVEFTTNGKDFLGKRIPIIGNNLLGDIKVELVISKR